LGIGLRTLQYRLKHYGLTGRRGRAAGTPAGREARAEAAAPGPAAGR